MLGLSAFTAEIWVPIPSQGTMPHTTTHTTWPKYKKKFFFKYKINIYKALVRASHIVSRYIVVQLLSRVQHCDPVDCSTQASLFFTISQSLHKPMPIESVMPSSHLILHRPLLLLPSVFPSIRVFSNELALHIRWPKYWSFSFSISPSNEYSGLISFRIDCFDLLAVQGTLKSLLQHHNSKTSII